MSTTNRIPERIESPAAWKGNELLRRDDWMHEFGSDEATELRDAAERTADLELDAIDRQNFELPRLGTKLASVQDSLEHGSGAAMLRGFPIEQFRNSDEEADAGSLDMKLLTRVFWGLAAHIGTAVSQSAQGDRIFSVRNEGYNESDPRARGPNTKKRLSYHTDRCDVIAFFCVQQANRAARTLWSVRHRSTTKSAA